jgi:hypothetical protein
MASDKEQEIFVEPEFIEKDFLQSEKERAKSTIVVFLLGAALGLFSGYLFLLGIWYVGLLLLFLFVISFKRIIEALHLKMPKRASQVFILVMVFILTWIIFWTVSLNPPVSAVGGPQVSSFQVYNPHTSTWSALAQSNGIYHYSISQNEVLSLRVYISYVTPINNVTITVSNGGSTPSPLTINYVNNYAYFNESVVPSLYAFNVDLTIHDTYYTSNLDLQILST